MATKDTTNNSDSIHLSEADVERVQIIVEQIAYHASLVSNTILQAVELLDGPQETDCLFAAKELVGKMGYLADMAAEKLGGATYESAESWLLPPSYQRIDEKPEVQ